jgi:hypothetical protein
MGNIFNFLKKKENEAVNYVEAQNNVTSLAGELAWINRDADPIHFIEYRKTIEKLQKNGLTQQQIVTILRQYDYIKHPEDYQNDLNKNKEKPFDEKPEESSSLPVMLGIATILGIGLYEYNK